MRHPSKIIWLHCFACQVDIGITAPVDNTLQIHDCNFPAAFRLILATRSELQNLCFDEAYKSCLKDAEEVIASTVDAA